MLVRILTCIHTYLQNKHTCIQHAHMHTHTHTYTHTHVNGIRTRIGEVDYEKLLAEGNGDFPYKLPHDEWDAIALGYTSGTVS
jgi:hypothetical protein